MSKVKRKLFSVIIIFVVFLAAAVLSVTLPSATKEIKAEGDILYLAPVYGTDGKVTFDADGDVVMETKTIADGTYNVVTNTDALWGEGTTATADANGEYWYVVNATVTMDTDVAVDGITVTGKVHLILCDGCALNMTFDTLTVSEDNELTIYGQENGTGTLKANCVSPIVVVPSPSRYVAALTGGNGEIPDEVKEESEG